MIDGLPPYPSQNDAYRSSICGWLQEALQEGEAMLKDEYGYTEIDRNIEYIMEGRNTREKRPQDIAYFSVNRIGKVHSDLLAGLTDVKPVFSFQTYNRAFEMQGTMLNKLVRAWWRNNSIDLKIGDAVSWSLAAGCGYTIPNWDPSLHHGYGDIDLATLDPRDVIPVRPFNRDSMQNCKGVIFRRPVTVNYLRARYPALRYQIQAEKEGSFTRSRKTRPAVHALDGLTGNRESTADMSVPMLDVYEIYLRDDSVWQSTDTPFYIGSFDEQGRPLTSWSYVVEPGAPLYPRGRLIVCTKTHVLEDGPNPYWHGMFPVSKLVLDPFPWSFMGKAAIRDLIPLNDLLTELVSKIAQKARKVLRPGIIADGNALSQAVIDGLNSEASGMKLRTRGMAGVEGVKTLEEPPLPPFVWDLVGFAIEQIDDIGGTRGLAELLSLKQVPGFDTLEKIQEAMTPAVRRRGRQIEGWMRDIAEMVKFNIFQFYNAGRRIQILGEDGITFEDFDYNPGQMLPDYATGDTAKTIEHIANFSFWIEPNSMLELTQTSKKLLTLQLARMGHIDHQTLLEVMEVPNIAQVNERLNSELDQKIAMLTGAQEGRPPTAQAPPQLQQKGDGRTVVSES